MTCKHYGEYELTQMKMVGINCPYCTIDRQAAEIEALRKDAARYTGIRALKYRMYAADARSLGPQMTWESEEVFNATHDARADAVIDAAMKERGDG